MPAGTGANEPGMERGPGIAPSRLEECVLMICEVILAAGVGHVEALDAAMDILERAGPAGIKVNSIKALRAASKAPKPPKPKKKCQTAFTYSS
jgi:hypothetical protein